MPRRLLIFFVLGVLVTLGVVRAAGESEGSARDLVARSIAYHGGEIYTSARSELLLCSKSGCSRLEVERDGGLYEYCATTKIEEGERRVCATNDRVEEFVDGELVIGRVAAGESGPPGSPADEARERQLRDWVMARVYFVFLPSRLEDPSVRLEDLGSEDWEGRSLRKIKVTFEPGTSTDSDDEFLYWFDPATARLEQFAYSYERNGGGLRFRRLTNYRREGGILFFDQENFGTEGPGLTVEKITSVYVEEAMRHVSTIELNDIEVTALE